MKNNISHEEKLEFYRSYNSEEFQTKLAKIKNNLFPIGFISLKVFSVAAILFGIFNPWLLFLAVPGVVTPFTVIAIGNHQQKQLIESINPNIKYKDFLQLQNSEEWQLLSYELSAKEMNAKHYFENSNKILEENINNTPRSLDCCIFEENNAQNNDKETNLVRKTEKRIKNQKIINKPRSLDCCIFKDEELTLTNELLCPFVEEYCNHSLEGFLPFEVFGNENIYKVLLKTKNNKILEFLVSYDSFICINHDFKMDLSKEWQQHLAKQNLQAHSI